MKPTLQLKLSQHLTLTPQLQQSIRLLQLSTLELNAEVERLLQENPLLEKADDDEGSAPPPDFAPTMVTVSNSDAQNEGVRRAANRGLRRHGQRRRRQRLGLRRPAPATTTTNTSRRSRLPPARCAIT